MDDRSPRQVLADLIAQHDTNFGALSKLLGRNPAYIQQFIKRGTPRKLAETDRQVLAAYFGVDEALLGAPVPPLAGIERGRKPREKAQSSRAAHVPILALEASAGVGTVPGEEWASAIIGFDRLWLKGLGLQPETLSIIEIKGESMAPTLNHADMIMVDRGDAAERLRDGIYVLRLEDMLMVKRVALSPREGRRQLTISSDNPHFPTWNDVDGTRVDIVGRVVWASRIVS